jgi:serine/threonine protein phosphatase PrpC
MTSNGSQQTVFVNRGEMNDPDVHPVAGGEVAVFSARSPAKETTNEDAAVLIPAGNGAAILAVADGLGGQRAGAEAAELAVKALAACVRAANDHAGLRAAILDGFERANQSVTDLGIGAATTLAAVEIEGSTIRPYHVGDSTILVVGQRGRIKLLTVSHSPVGYAVEAGLLDEHEAIHHEDRHLVSNIVGSPEMRIEIGRPLALNPLDTVLLGSDGLFDNLHVAEVVEVIRKGRLAEVAGTLAEACRRRMQEPEPDHPSHPDDLTFLIYRRTM